MTLISSSPTISFEPFPRLPAELRLKIWSLALTSLPPQTFGITTRNIRKPHKHHITIIHATTPPPSLFHANQEARLKALEHYSQIPSTKISTLRSAQDYPPDNKYVFINFSIDIFSVERISYDIPYDPSEALKRIQHLKTVAKDVVFFGEEFQDAHLSRLDALKEVEVSLLEGANPTWYLEDKGVGKLVDAFERARRGKPEWVFPRIRIVEEGVVLRVYEGGVSCRRNPFTSLQGKS